LQITAQVHEVMANGYGWSWLITFISVHVVEQEITRTMQLHMQCSTTWMTSNRWQRMMFVQRYWTRVSWATEPGSLFSVQEVSAITIVMA